MKKQQLKIKFKDLGEVPFNIFDKFIKSLKNERNSWSLEKNIKYFDTGRTPKTAKEWYDVVTTNMPDCVKVAYSESLPSDEIIGFVQTNGRTLDDWKYFTKSLGVPYGCVTCISFIVKEKYQGQGIGTKMIKHVLEDPSWKGKVVLHTAVMNTDNFASWKSFHKNGFKTIDYYDPKQTQYLVAWSPKDVEIKYDLFSPQITNNKIYMSKITNCVSTYNNLNYLKLLIKSVRKNSYFLDSPFVVYAENCTDGTNEWLEENKEKYNLDVYIEPNNKVRRGIGGGMNFCASKVKTEFINFLQSDLYVAKNWDIELLKKFTKYPNKRMIVFGHRVQPNIFNEESRSGTVIVPTDEFGEYHHNFNEEYFLDWAKQFSEMNDFEIRKSEGVSGLIRKKDWDYIGGNDDRFAPAYWEDADLFIRMLNEDFKFVLTSTSVLYHFGSRASRFPDDNLKIRPTNLAEIEQRSTQRFIEKYGKLPERDEHDFYIPLQIVDGSPNRINQ